MNYNIPLHPGRIYHVISHAIGSEQLFRTAENYSFFLYKFFHYTNPIAETLTYCLMPNHFHFMIRILPEEKIADLYREVKKREVSAELLPDFIMKQFSNMLNSYAKSYNSLYKRKGSLFIDYMRRVEIESEDQYTATILYIHKNPVKHGFCKSLHDWEWNGYHELCSKGHTFLQRKEVLDWFGDKNSFIKSHDAP